MIYTYLQCCSIVRITLSQVTIKRRCPSSGMLFLAILLASVSGASRRELYIHPSVLPGFPLAWKAVSHPGLVPYSGKLSREGFFAVSEPSAKVFSAKFLAGAWLMREGHTLDRYRQALGSK